MADRPGAAMGPTTTKSVPGLHRLRLDVLLHELVNRAEDIIGVEHKLHRLLDAVVSVASEQSLPDTLRRITELAAELSDAEFAALGVIGPDQQNLVEFITVGMKPHARAAIGDLPSGKGILGLIITHPEPLRAAGSAAAPGVVRVPAEPPADGHLPGGADPGPSRGLRQPLPDREAGRRRVHRAGRGPDGRAGRGGRDRDRERPAVRGDPTPGALAGGFVGGDRQPADAGPRPSETTQLVVDKAAEIVEADAAFLLLRDDDSDELIVLAAHGEEAGEYHRPRATPLTDALAGQLFVDGQARPFSSGAAVMQAGFGPSRRRCVHRSGVLVPLGSGGRVLGSAGRGPAPGRDAVPGGRRPDGPYLRRPGGASPSSSAGPRPIGSAWRSTRTAIGSPATCTI